MKKLLFHKKWLTTTIAIPSLLLAIFLAPAMGKAWAPTITADAYFEKMVLLLSAWTNSKKDVLNRYCTAMVDNDIAWWYLDDNKIYYTPKNSLFVQALCKEISGKDIFYNKDIIKWTSWSMILWNNIKWCEGSDFRDCQLDELLPALFNASMNDHSILSVAWWTMKEWLDENIQEFSKTYFSSLEKICWEKDSEFISAKGAASSKNALCSHPNTYQSLKSTIESLQKQQNHLSIIEWKNFWWGIKWETDCNETNRYNHLFECAYTNSSSEATLWYQHNIRYNELLYYKMLISWLTEIKLKDTDIKPLNLTKDVVLDLSDEIQNLKREAILSDNAVQIMQKTINNIRATFPLHIWLQLYYEDVVWFRKSLAKIYTPIHQLNYKLRNIQEKK